MAKITISRLFEVSKILKTEAGKQLSDLINYTSELAEQVLRALRNGLTFEDNFNSKILTISATHNTLIKVYISDKIPTGILIRRILSSSVMVDAFNWHIDDNGTLNLKILFNPASSDIINIELIITF